MNRALSAVTLSSILLLASAPAYAVSTWTHLTAENIGEQHLSFTVKLKDLEPLKEYEIVIREKSGELSPFLNAHLSLYDGKAQIAACPIEAVRNRDDVIYRFQVHPRYFEKSKFVFAEMAYAKRKDEHGREQIIGMPSLMVPLTRVIENRWLQFDPDAGGTLVSLIENESLRQLREHGHGLIIQGLAVCAARDALELYLNKGREAFLARAPIRKHRDHSVKLPERISRFEIYPSLVEDMRYSGFRYSDAWEGTILVRLTSVGAPQGPIVLEIGATASSAGITSDQVQLLLWKTRKEEPTDRPAPLSLQSGTAIGQPDRNG